MLACLVVVMFCLNGAQVAAYSSAQLVYGSPGGKVVGGVREGDTVKIKQLETIYRNSHSERWAFIIYGDRYTRGTGWVNMDTFRKTPPKPATQSHSGYPFAQNSNPTPATIWDINMHCSKNNSPRIQSCELQMIVDVALAYETYDNMLDCSAELHWTDIHGISRVSRQQASQPVGADSKRHSLDLYFSFGHAGAKSATVENQKCATVNASQGLYAPY